MRLPRPTSSDAAPDHPGANELGHPSPSGGPRGTRGPAILELLAAEGKAVRRSEVRRRLGLGEAQLSHLLSDLEGAGLVRRSKSAKGREVLVELGPAGREAVKAEILPSWVEVFLSEMSAMRSGWRTKPELLAAELERAGAPSRLAAERISTALAALPSPPHREAGEVRDRGGDRKTPLLEPEESEEGEAMLDIAARFEIGKERREMLEKAAHGRGGGVTASDILQEAVDSYFDREEDRKALVRGALSVLGTLDDAAAAEMEETVRRLRSSWR